MSRYCAHHFFFFNDTATTEIYTLSLHDALPIYEVELGPVGQGLGQVRGMPVLGDVGQAVGQALVDADAVEPRNLVLQPRSEEHTSELQSQSNLVCRLLLEKKKYQLRMCISTSHY